MADPASITRSLGFSPAEARAAQDRVEATLHSRQCETVPTTRVLSDGSRIHRHQYVTGPNETNYVVLDLSGDGIQLGRVRAEQGQNTPSFDGTQTVTEGDLLLQDYTAKTTPDGTPMWVY